MVKGYIKEIRRIEKKLEQKPADPQWAQAVSEMSRSNMTGFQTPKSKKDTRSAAKNKAIKEQLV